MKKTAAPNYTQMPNSLIDSMPELSDAELRVALAICRQTFGYHRDAATMSQTFLATATGMSTVACSKAGGSLAAKGLIQIVKTHRINIFKLVVENLPETVDVKAEDPLTALPDTDNAVNGLVAKTINGVTTSTINGVSTLDKEKNKRNTKGDESEKLSFEKRKFMASWKDAYRFKFRTEYSPTNRGADEATASRRIKEGSTSDYLMTLAKSAWAAEQDGNHWACNNRSFFIADFLNALPRIKIELTNQVARKNYGTNANTGTLNAGKASQYRGVGQVVPVPDPQRTGT